MNMFQRVVEQVELFIKKFYKNEMVKGSILFLAVLLFSYLLVSGLEYLGRFGSATRFFLLISFILVNGFILIRYLVIPLFKLNKLTKHLTIWEASDMIGSVFPDIGDKLRNTLQLEKQMGSAELNLELVRASIEQRSANLSVIPFSSAIDLRENRRYLKYLLPVLLLFLGIAIANPKWFTEGTERVFYYDQEFVPPAPFEFVLASDDEVREGEDYQLEIKLEGNEIPDEVVIISNAGNYNLEQRTKTSFVYTFTNVGRDLTFYAQANGFKSKQFDIHVLLKPVIESISLNVIYPRHTGMKPTRFDNSGDIAIPEGSTVEWAITARNLSKLDVAFADTSLTLKSSLTNNYSFKKQFFNSDTYLLATSSAEIERADSLNYAVTVIKDEYPVISIEEQVDSMNSLRRFIDGKIADDYGFRGLTAVMKIIGKDTSYTVSKGIKINPNVTNQLFSFYIDLSQFELKPGDRIEYSFSVTDNDEINDFKTTNTGKKVYAVPTLDELDNQQTENSDKLESELDQAMKDAEQLKQEIKDIKSSMINKPNLDWKDKQQLENLMMMQKDLNERIEQLKQDFDKNNQEAENFLEESEELKEKKEQLEALMEELMDEELMKLFEELQELMEQMDKNDLIQNLEQMEQKAESMEDELDRTLELFKNMEIDQKLENLAKQLEELAAQQEELNQLTDDKKLTPEQLAEKQDAINKKFDEIQKDMDEIEEKNQELQNPRDMEFDQEMEEAIEQETNESKENLDKNNRNKSQENQSKAAEMMKQMSESVSSMMMQMASAQQGEDMDALRYLLENIVALSKRQEALMAEFKVTNVSDPYYNKLSEQQQEIMSATEVVNDSLEALSKRVFQLSSFITEELADLNYNLENAMVQAEERRPSEAMQSQQYAMTGYNDLALMLSEVLSQMQKQAQQQQGQPGSGSCPNPGGAGQGSKPGDKMSMQQMKDALQQQINQMKNGPNPGGKEGQGSMGQPGQGNKIPGLSNEQIVKMAAQQSQMRERLKEMREELNEDGSGAGNELNDIIDELDQLEKDLLNGNFGGDYVKRQQDILTRMLESEKAIRERGFSEERESNEGKNTENGNLIEFTEYNRKKNAEVEFLRSMPIGLQVYYKTLVNEYFNSVNN